MGRVEKDGNRGMDLALPRSPPDLETNKNPPYVRKPASETEVGSHRLGKPRSSVHSMGHCEGLIRPTKGLVRPLRALEGP